MVDLSVVICTVNRPDLIAGAVESVLRGTFEDIELLVIDQSPGPATRDALHPLTGDARLRYVHSDRVGLSAAYNTGIRASAGPVIAFTDDDCIAPTDWAVNIMGAFADFPSAELLYGQVAAPAGDGIPPGIIPTLEFSERRLLSRAEGFQVFGMGANFAARRRLLDALGGFDEVLGGGGPLRSSQDFDLQYRAYRHGAICLLEPNVSVLHYGLREHDRWPQTLSAYGEGDGGFYMKHIRCGDLLATRLFAGRLAHETARAAVKPLLRRPHSAAYLRGMVSGARHSFRHGVNRQTRTYELAGATGGRS